MWDVLSALIPPAVVAAVFCTAIFKLLRKEMAPRTVQDRPAAAEEGGSGNNAGHPGPARGDLQSDEPAP